MENYLGGLAAVVWALSGAYIAVKAIRNGEDRNDRWFLVLWLMGTILYSAYTILYAYSDKNILFGYIVDGILAGIALYYNMFPRRKKFTWMSPKGDFIQKGYYTKDGKLVITERKKNGLRWKRKS